jgi:hypothetical protein
VLSLLLLLLSLVKDCDETERLTGIDDDEDEDEDDGDLDDEANDIDD